MIRILPVRISFHILYLPLLIILLVASDRLAADELKFVIDGVTEPELILDREGTQRGRGGGRART